MSPSLLNSYCYNVLPEQGAHLKSRYITMRWTYSVHGPPFVTELSVIEIVMTQMYLLRRSSNCSVAEWDNDADACRTRPCWLRFFAASRNVMFIFFKLFQRSDGRFCIELRSFSRKLHFAIAPLHSAVLLPSRYHRSISQLISTNSGISVFWGHVWTSWSHVAWRKYSFVTLWVLNKVVIIRKVYVVWTLQVLILFSGNI